MTHYALVDTIFCCIFPKLNWSTCIFVLKRQDSSGAIILLYHWATNELSPLHYYWTKVLGFQLHKQKDNGGLCVSVLLGQPLSFWYKQPCKWQGLRKQLTDAKLWAEFQLHLDETYHSQLAVFHRVMKVLLHTVTVYGRHLKSSIELWWLIH